jgi:hypothetical protein
VAHDDQPPPHRPVALHTALDTWDRYPYGIHQCEVCDALYDYWLGCEGCGTPLHAARTLDAPLDELVEVVRP